MANLIKCPKCGEQIEITSALKAEISEQIKIEAKEEVRKELEEKNSLETADLKRILEEKDKKLAEFREQELKALILNRLSEAREVLSAVSFFGNQKPPKLGLTAG